MSEEMIKMIIEEIKSEIQQLRADLKNDFSKLSDDRSSDREKIIILENRIYNLELQIQGIEKRKEKNRSNFFSYLIPILVGMTIMSLPQLLTFLLSVFK